MAAKRTLVVLDNSAALGLLLPDERGDSSTAELMAQAPYVQFIAPALWRYEIANGLTMALRRGRIQPSDLLWIYAEIKNLFIKVQHDAQDPEILIAVAQKSGLTAYDAAYLELTLRLNARLATNDKQLRAAALTAGLVVL